jgi:hypothetical protein
VFGDVLRIAPDGCHDARDDEHVLEPVIDPGDLDVAPDGRGGGGLDATDEFWGGRLHGDEVSGSRQK